MPTDPASMPTRARVGSWCRDVVPPPCIPPYHHYSASCRFDDHAARLTIDFYRPGSGVGAPAPGAVDVIHAASAAAAAVAPEMSSVGEDKDEVVVESGSAAAAAAPPSAAPAAGKAPAEVALGTAGPAPTAQPSTTAGGSGSGNGYICGVGAPAPGAVDALSRSGNDGPRLSRYPPVWTLHRETPSLTPVDAVRSSCRFAPKNTFCLRVMPLVFVVPPSPPPLAAKIV